nr:subtilisin-like protease sbt4.10 [Quercus suber]
MYKVCWLEGCSDVDLLARMDDAINDGVDLISISIGGPLSSFFDDAMSSYLDDPISIGAFHTMMKRILTTCSARNDDPYASSVANTAPWIMIVGASAIDRQFSTLLDIVAPGVDILACYSKLISITGSPDDNQVNVYNIISGTSIACPHVTGAAMFHLQPDIVAPGVDIFACYSKLRSITGSPDDNQVNVYNIISGTSIACPHVTGAAAHVKTFHPNWSPIAIKSALMTTVKDDHAELAYGAGHIDPIRALQPGLIYNSSKFDYARFLCNEDYTGIAISLFTNENTSCSSLPNIGGQDALNYPSMSLQLNNPNSSISTMFRRKVTNVGSERAIYKAIVKAPTNLKVTVVPKQLAFSHLHEEKYFMVVKKGPPLNNISSLSA